MEPLIKRRTLLGSAAAAWLADQLLPDRTEIRGSLKGASREVGHLLRRGGQQSPSGPREEADVVIVGSGASALNAAWRLTAAGAEPLLLELEPQLGGTSSWGDDGVVSHPWGAHYLPVPERGAHGVARLLEEFGVITGWDGAGRPRFLAEMLCHAPEERLHYRGRWHRGVIPVSALTPAELAEVKRFQAVQNELMSAIGNDGREAFALPFSKSSRDPRFLELDRLSMADWLKKEGFSTPFIYWYVGYAVMDDFGGDLTVVSAWAGWHYFASRKLSSDQLDGSRFLVWPEGNGWLLKRMLARLPQAPRAGALVTSVREEKRGVTVQYFDVAEKRLREVHARAAIIATPAFIAKRLMPSAATRLPERQASPWVVANLHVRRPEEPNRAWDSILHGASGLGYVDAGHQRFAPSDETVLTYFRAYGAPDVKATRRMLQAKRWHHFASEALIDLGRVHPELRQQTKRIDVKVWGHAMPRPEPGFIGRRPFESEVMLGQRIAWAHVDQTGFALFEEANDRGLKAAEAICKVLDLPCGESWT